MEQIQAEIKKIAKLLESEKVADEGGEYKNFTGKIDYRGSKAKVKNAHFLLGKSIIGWLDGVWLNGTFKDGFWNKGTWVKGIWKRGEWYDGDWKNGTWENGVWNGGKWHNGTWKNGDWWKGTWVKGDWKGGTWVDKRIPHPNER